MAESGKGPSRVLAKLKKSIESGSYYEAHQMYRTLYARYVIGKKYEEALSLMYDGATLLLSNNQQTSGADIAMLYLEVIEKSHMQLKEDHIGKISKIFSMMNNSIPERHQFLVRAIKCSMGDEHKMGHPSLHKSLAIVWWKEHNFSSACYHFIRSDHGVPCGTMLVEWHLLKGYPSEVDLFVVRPVLQYLCLQKKTQASDVFESYTQAHPNIKSQNGPPYLMPLLNFIWLLLTAIDNKKVSQFTVLCEQYKISIERDPVYNAYLHKIGQLFFNIPPPQTRPAGGFLGNLLEGLLGNLTEDSSTEESAAPDLD